MILRLTLTKKWFDMIESGEKKEEYREIKQYWSSRFLWEQDEPITCVESLKDVVMIGHLDGWDGYSPVNSSIFKDFIFIEFRNGYRKDARTMTVECLGITYGQAKPEWSDNWQGDVYIIQLGKVFKP